LKTSNALFFDAKATVSIALNHGDLDPCLTGKIKAKVFVLKRISFKRLVIEGKKKVWRVQNGIFS
jgi:hypothetical protein